MRHILFLLLRRMRTPLIVLICAYAVSVLGFVLIPGQDGDGRAWQMDFFHAFYFVSFMGATIGFGELPYPFTGAQRLWTLFTMYVTVFAWLYAIGSLIALLQLPLFRAEIIRSGLIKRVGRIRRPFYLLCGCGDAGTQLLNALDNRGIDLVVIDSDQNRINELELESRPHLIAALNGSAADMETLTNAGLKSAHCVGVIALIGDAQVNLKIAIASKLLNAGAAVYCRADTHDVGHNMASFGTEHIVNPYDIFVDWFSSALTSPSLYLLGEWLSSAPARRSSPPLLPPAGRWILCGYGRFGRAMYQALQAHGSAVTVIENNPQTADLPGGAIIGRGTEADTLAAARVEQADGIIAGTDHDINNLSIILTAKDMQPALFTLARQELTASKEIFAAARPDLIFNHSRLLADYLRLLITTPLIARFLSCARQQSEAWSKSVADRLLDCVGQTNPAGWVIAVEPARAPAVFAHIDSGGAVELHHLMRQPGQRAHTLPCIALLLHRHGQDRLLPDDDTPIYPQDQILFAGSPAAEARTRHICTSIPALHYVITGETAPASYLWNRLARRFSAPPD